MNHGNEDALFGKADASGFAPTTSGWTRKILGFRAYRSDLGDYMSRWVFKHPLGTVRLHHIRRPDMDVELHDHPWWFFSLILKGWYEEECPRRSLLRFWRSDIADAARGRSSMVCDTIRAKLAPVEVGDVARTLHDREVVYRRRFSLAFRHAEDPHRITKIAPGGAWTLRRLRPQGPPLGLLGARGLDPLARLHFCQRRQRMIIGVFGYKGHGKDAVGAVLAAEGFLRESFARPLKNMLKAGLNLSEAQVNGDLKEVIDPRYGTTPRRMMQTLGTEWGRNCVGKSVWLDALCDRVEARLRRGDDFVVTDVRFLNEAETIITRLGGRLIYVNRPGVPADTSHASEQGVAEILANHRWYSLMNDGSLQDLRQKTLQALTDLRSTT
jgi:hypothetical protein